LSPPVPTVSRCFHKSLRTVLTCRRCMC
jgi:hypothetical protein